MYGKKTELVEWKLVTLETCETCGECHSSSTQFDLDSSSEGIIGTSKCFSFMKPHKLKEFTTDDFTFSDDVIMGDQDVWIEQSFKSKQKYIKYYYYHSLKTRKNVFGSPPTDASVVINEFQLPSCHPVIQLYAKKLPRLNKKIIRTMRKAEDERLFKK